MKYAQADKTGAIINFFDDEINSTAQIGSAIKITEAQWQDCINNHGKWIIVAGALQLAPPLSPSALAAIAKTNTNAPLLTQLDAIDTLKIRPLSDMQTNAAGSASYTFASTKLAALEKQASDLRAQLVK
jgi:hypothetical protein